MKDVQVTAKESPDAIRAVVTGGGNPAVTTVQLPGLNHVFQTCGRPSTEYGKIEKTFAPAALNVVSDRIRRQHGFEDAADPGRTVQTTATRPRARKCLGP